jgi:hypothetical protein
LEKLLYSAVFNGIDSSIIVGADVYSLNAIVFHYGEDIQRGHFTLALKFGTKWFYVDDAKVYPFSMIERVEADGEIAYDWQSVSILKNLEPYVFGYVRGQRPMTRSSLKFLSSVVTNLSTSASKGKTVKLISSSAGLKIRAPKKPQSALDILARVAEYTESAEKEKQASGEKRARGRPRGVAPDTSGEGGAKKKKAT